MRIAYLIAALAVGFCGLPAAAQKSDECRVEASDADLLACANSKPDRSPEQVRAFVTLGTRAYVRGDYQSALTSWLRTRPGEGVSEARFHARRAYVFVRTRRADLATADADLALSMLKAGKELVDGSVIKTEEMYELYPLVIDTLSRLHSPRVDEAAASFLAQQPRGWQDHMERATVLAQLTRYEEALGELDVAQSEKPDAPVLKNNRCIVLGRLNRPTDALPLCEQAVAAEPENVDYRMTLIRAYLKAGQCDKAQGTLEVAKNKFPGAFEGLPPLTCKP